jgi:GTPase SAR1 family protein
MLPYNFSSPGSHAAIMMFEFESRISYKTIPNVYRYAYLLLKLDSVFLLFDLFREIINGCGNIPTVMVGNKIDLPDEKRKLKVDKVLYHRKIGTPFYTISVKKMINLEKPLLYLISQLIGRNDVRFVEDPAIPPPMEESSMRTEENLREMEQLTDAGAQVPLPDQDDDGAEESEAR